MDVTKIPGTNLDVTLEINTHHFDFSQKPLEVFLNFQMDWYLDASRYEKSVVVSRFLSVVLSVVLSLSLSLSLFFNKILYLYLYIYIYIWRTTDKTTDKND